MKRDYNVLRNEILKKKLSLEEAISASSTDIVFIDNTEINKDDAKKLKIAFENFLNSDSKNFKRIFIPVKLITNNTYWNNLQALFNKVYEAK